jgi:hypothetical protein
MWAVREGIIGRREVTRTALNTSEASIKNGDAASKNADAAIFTEKNLQFAQGSLKESM